MKGQRIRLRVGDILEIPLSDGRHAYAQYVFFDDKVGGMIQVFDLITKQRASLDQIKGAKPLFAPILTGLRAAVRSGLWARIGHAPVEGFSYPEFVTPQVYDKEGPRNWYLWDERRTFIFLGRDLPDQYRHLERLAGWDPRDVADHIEKARPADDTRRTVDHELQLFLV